MVPGPPFLHPHYHILLFLLLSSTTITTCLHPPTTTTISPTKAPTAPTPTTSPSPEATPSTPHPTPTTPVSTAPLDPEQVRALQSLHIPTSKDPCSPLHNSTTICDSSKPFSHLISLTFSDCSDDVALSTTALKSLSTLTSLSFINCPITPIRFPSELSSNLHSFTCVNSLKKLSGVWLTKLGNVTELTVSQVPIKASGPWIILDSIKKLHSVTLSHTNLTGSLPKKWHPNLTHVDLSGNQLKGKIPSSINVMEDLLVLNLSSNSLDGEIPTSIGDFISLQNLSLSSNSLSGEIPDSVSAMPGLIHLDLGSNQLNGTVPKFIQDMKHLKYLNLEKNSFHGVLPFNASFVNKLEVFKVGGNDNLCYNHTSFSSMKMKLGIAPCDKHGMPMSPPPAKDSSGDSSSDSSDDDYNEDDGGQKEGHHHHGPNKVVLGISIALSSIVFLIVFMVLLNKCCK